MSPTGNKTGTTKYFDNIWYLVSTVYFSDSLGFWCTPAKTSTTKVTEEQAKGELDTALNSAQRHDDVWDNRDIAPRKVHTF